ncbi:MAG: radical SAM protein [Clostridia bacterium]|nr:radical SAM protein [Clostridia bacterium]
MQKKPYSRVYVEITNICNRSCSFCHGTSRPSARMSLERFRYIACELRPLTDYLYFHVMGEPLTHPSLADMIEYATSLGFKCAVTTNGTLLDSVGDKLISSGVYKVNVSVHSFEEGTDEDYYSYLSSIADFAEKSSAKGVLTVLRLWNKGTDGGRNDRTLEFFKSRLVGEWKWGARGARIHHKLHLEYGDRFEWPDMEAKEGDGRVFCYGLSDHFGILSDGTVIPCCLDSEGTINLGNIFDTGIGKILSSERSEAIQRGFSERVAVEPLCSRCGYARRFK